MPVANPETHIYTQNKKVRVSSPSSAAAAAAAASRSLFLLLHLQPPHPVQCIGPLDVLLDGPGAQGLRTAKREGKANRQNKSGYQAR
jgi:hypothetical protein